jgi:hypothetical protein
VRAFHALHCWSLTTQPRQVEVLFVLCTLLGSRRKIDLQHILADLGLLPVLTTMFDRLSWGSPPAEGPNPLERIHGAGEVSLRRACKASGC